jgi:hypothetical protein
MLRTGGVTIFHEIDLTETHPTWPVWDVWDANYRLLATVYRAAGATPDFGRRSSGRTSTRASRHRRSSRSPRWAVRTRWWWTGWPCRW